MDSIQFLPGKNKNSGKLKGWIHKLPVHWIVFLKNEWNRTDCEHKTRDVLNKIMVLHSESKQTCAPTCRNTTTHIYREIQSSMGASLFGVFNDNMFVFSMEKNQVTLSAQMQVILFPPFFTDSQQHSAFCAYTTHTHRCSCTFILLGLEFYMRQTCEGREKTRRSRVKWKIKTSAYLTVSCCSYVVLYEGY